jgi:hypothetical protein
MTPLVKPAKGDFRCPDMDAEFAAHTAKMPPVERLGCAAARLAATLWLVRVVLDHRGRA